MRVLMCSPAYFDVPEGIPKEEYARWNPWMNPERPPNRKTAFEQWRGLYTFYQKQNLEIFLLKSKKGLFDQTFVANIACVWDNRAVMANLAPAWRKEEVREAAQWFAGKRFSIEWLPEHISFEGQGDIIRIGKSTFLFCYGLRNSIAAVDYLEKIFGIRGKVIPLKLINRNFYHGDISIRYFPNNDALLWNPSAFDTQDLGIIERLPVKKKMEAPEALWVQKTDQGWNFPLNGCFANKVETFPWEKIMGEFPRHIREWIEKDGVEIWLHNFDQFGLSGAGHQCTTLNLNLFTD